ncbi:Coenzyme F420 hydrogenase/dehydrogenase, beta subunit C-terminal domain [Cellulomonas fimi]|uniref:Coenzyme F420 hydrogenase/dehydrogenase, beta subunit C-terminal domain n=1 Tax=Cellulomonas fimi TaxID=1708 RepID=UPI00234D05AC|nr:Coenzyme F420 hydrogenase/dehydrogenase, beta subunit C-terminal domain [Cellulomonas fimi]MDC7121643.1 Coenzyme F420 hydrogenase/dehydrogenase, beta subunit C-terminal domain [Cellulomonas fimi]
MTRIDPGSRRVLLAVVGGDNCSGCGGCAAAFDDVRMTRSADGYARPEITEVDAAPTGPAPRLDTFCPGAALDAPRRPGGDVVVGRSFGVWQGWATDPALRRSGSSGGILTALSAWLLADGRAVRSVGVGADARDAARSVSVVAHNPGSAALLAGSRYAPVSVAGEPSAYDADSVVTGKPCEVSAIRRRLRDVDEQPILMSFFCAGVPSQGATAQLVGELGLDANAPLRSLRYRGDGWPGRFTAEDAHGASGEMSYEKSWGDVLGRRLQWRCKICVDGVGEDADIVAGDYWDADERGYPRFDEADGRSVVIARTPRGAEVLRAAEAAGVVALDPVDPASVSQMQPYQVRRRVTLLGRLVGARLAGRQVPRYRGYGLLRWSLRDPLRAVYDGWGSYRRARAGRQDAAARTRA